MKKLFTFLFLTASMLYMSYGRAIAQVITPGIDLIAAGDSSWNSSCVVPDVRDMYCYGTASGYSATDSILINIAFGDGTDTSFYMIPFQGSVYFSSYINHIYTLPGLYAAQFIATGPDGSTDTIVDNTILVATQCNTISGKLYLDNNNNCIYDAGDSPVTWSYVEASFNGSGIAYGGTDSLGDYSISVPSGFTYTITPYYYNSFTVACPVAGSYSVSTFPSTGNDFALLCNPQSDLTGNIYGQGFRNNASTTLWLSAYNKLATCASPNATVTVTLDPLLSYVSSSATPLSVSGSQIVFNAGQLLGYNYSDFNTALTLLTDISANLGDTLCITMTIDPMTGDANPADNTVTVCMLVRNSCDPNEKEELHAGAGTANVAHGTELAYTIMFQNVGNDEAYKVSVVDDIDQNLDLSTLKITGYSFQPEISVTGNTLKFDFNNINLAAASVNEPMSHGYVAYKIKPKTSAVIGTTINNYAKINFDYNPSIITNTVTDIIALTTGLNTINYTSDVAMYPNPSNESFAITTATKTASLLTIYDVTGRTIIAKHVVSDKQIISTKGLNAGVYFVTLISDGKTHTGKLLVK